ncbi:MAG: DUF111 family protein [Halanaerobiales bacterium]|nr:DUF111 family protein [Halanaerobiales bacterium]
MAVIEANIDDMNPELYRSVMEKLFKEGAVDVFMIPIIMKKGRPANVLTALTPPERIDQVVEVFFRETTSIGLRISQVEKRFLPREIIEVPTLWGKVKAKACYYKGEMVNLALEYEDCRRLAEEVNIPIKRIYQLIGQNK